MPRTFAYVRVSTTGQTTENQIQEIEAVGFQVEPRRIVTETVSGSTAIAQRRGFSRLMDKLESGDILVVTSSTAWDVMRSTSAPPSEHWPKWA
jgi:putative DNA-invertase from lambdoid prophage Rac